MSIFDKDTYSSVEEIEILIQEGMDINSVDEKELTPLLHLADPKRNESENLFEIFCILIQNGADINCKNKEGKNVLHLLCEHYKKEDLIDFISLLIENGIDINSKSLNSENALFYLLESDVKNDLRDDIVKLLICHGIQFSNKYYEMLQKCGMEERYGELDVLQCMAEKGLTLGWHTDCGSCCYIMYVIKNNQRKNNSYRNFKPCLHAQVN